MITFTRGERVPANRWVSLLVGRRVSLDVIGRGSLRNFNAVLPVAYSLYCLKAVNQIIRKTINCSYVVDVKNAWRFTSTIATSMA